MIPSDDYHMYPVNYSTRTMTFRLGGKGRHSDLSLKQPPDFQLQRFSISPGRKLNEDEVTGDIKETEVDWVDNRSTVPLSGWDRTEDPRGAVAL